MLKEWNYALDQIYSSIHIIYLGNEIYNFKYFILNLFQHVQSFLLFHLGHGYFLLLLFSKINSLHSVSEIRNPFFIIQRILKSAKSINRVKRMQAFLIFSFIFPSLDLILWLFNIWVNIVLVLDSSSIFNFCVLNYSYSVAFTRHLTQRFHSFRLFFLNFQF